LDHQISFSEFKSDEVDVGLDYAERVLGERLNREILRVVGNHAGAIRRAEKVVPRVAAVQALRAYERKNRIDIGYRRFEGYVRAISKMLAERNPRTREKRRRKREIADIKAAS
jgi:hypothetical protein